MPAFTTALLFSIGPSVAKALLAAMLSDYPVIKDIAPDLLEMLRDRAKDERGKREAGALMGTLGEHVAAQIRPLLAEARLDDTARVAVLRELLITLQQANAEQMIASRVDARRLRDTLLAHRADATKALNAAETALYQRAIDAAAQALVPLASELYGFESLRDAALLQGLDDSAARDARLLTLFTALLGQPEAASARFEQRYRAAISERLDKLELIGVRRLNTARQRQRLNVAYVTVEVDHQRARGDETDAALRQAFAEAGRAHASDEALQASPIDAVLATERRIVVRGDPGSGKTTLLQWVAVKAAAEAFAGPLSLWNKLVPFFIRLREIGVKTAEFPRPEEYIARIEPDLAGSCPANDWAHMQLEHGRAVLLIDGVDELPTNKRGEFLERLQDLLRLYPLARYIITSRPAAVSAANWPEWHAWVQEAGFTEVVIKDMSPTAINSFIDQWHRAYERASDDPSERAELPIAAAHLKQRLDAQAGMRRLAANPLLCSMICALHLERRNTLPSERIELYRECIDMLMEQRDAGRDISLADYPQLNTTKRHELLQDLAFRMMRNSELELDDETVLTQFTHFLPRLSLEQIAPARLLNYFVARTGLLRAPAEGMIDFPHRSFQEYFTAKAIADTAEVGLLLDKAYDESWRETIALAAGAGMLPQKRREDLLRGLLYGKQRKPRPGAPPLAATTPPGHRALALACLETAGNIDPALRQEVFAGAQALFPPYSREQQRLVAAAGDHAIPYLVAERQPNIAAGAACIATLARIGGDQALAAIESYLPHAHEVLESAIDAAWPSFDYRRFARRLLSQRTRISVHDAALLPLLAELPQLTTLDLSGTPVSDLSGLAQLPHLTTLDLSDTQVSDLSVLAQLPHLTTLYLSSTPVSDLSVLAQLPHLTTLNLSSTPVSDLSGLAQLPHLTTLNLMNTPVSDLRGLAELPQLTTLYLNGTPVSDLSGLAQLPHLTTLNLMNTPVSDLRGLAQLPHLTTLDLSGTRVSDLRGLAQLPHLTTLDLSSTQVSDLSGLAQLPHLTTLDLSSTQVSDLSGLAQLPHLTTLDLSDTQVSDLRGLAQLPHLTTLDLSDTQVSDLSGLAQLPHLTTLDLSDTPVSDLSGLAQLPHLTTLDLSRTKVSDLSVLKTLPNLARLSV